MLNEIHRPHFEGCVLTHVMQEIKSRGLCIEGSEKYTDYRDQLISWEEYEQGVEVFCGSGALAHGLPFVKRVRSGLEPIVQDTNVSFSHNNQVRIETGQTVITKLKAKSDPEGLKILERYIADNLEPINILNMFADTEYWLH